MGSHRADSSAPRSESSASSYPSGVAGKRAARPTPKRRASQEAAPVQVRVSHRIERTARPKPAPGRRVATRGPLFKGVPSAPALLGVAVLAVSVGGALQVHQPRLTGSHGDPARILQANALNGTDAVSSTSLLQGRGVAISRDARRDQARGTAGQDLRAKAEAQSKERDAALAQLASKAQVQARKLKANQWVLPVAAGVYHLTARFGDVSYLWSHVHTGLDFAAPSGTPIMAVASGDIDSTEYSGAYGNRTVETLPDGTELWYCHQTSYLVSPGQHVTAGQTIGYVGSTGNVTGPHLHLEVHPGGGDPVDPYAALLVHGVQP